MKLLTFFIFLLNFACSNTQVSMNENNKTDSGNIKKPEYMSSNATLMNYGSKEEPIFVWADYGGVYKKDGKEYTHIHLVNYYYVNAKKQDTMYYENLQLRNGSKFFDFSKAKILEESFGGRNIGIASNKDTINLFFVLEKKEFISDFNNIIYRRTPMICLTENKEYKYDNDVRLNIKKDKQDNYLVSFVDYDINNAKYKLIKKRKELQFTDLNTISFVNKEDGIIYFLNNDFYIEPTNKSEIKNLKKYLQ